MAKAGWQAAEPDEGCLAMADPEEEAAEVPKAMAAWRGEGAA